MCYHLDVLLNVDDAIYTCSVWTGRDLIHDYHNYEHTHVHD